MAPANLPRVANSLHLTNAGLVCTWHKIKTVEGRKPGQQRLKLT